MQPLPEPQAARQAPPGIVRPHFESASLAVIVADVMQALAAYVVEVLATMPAMVTVKLDTTIVNICYRSGEIDGGDPRPLGSRR
jgi:hypothetical protein